jgi:hypothetical protein
LFLRRFGKNQGCIQGVKPVKASRKQGRAKQLGAVSAAILDAYAKKSTRFKKFRTPDLPLRNHCKNRAVGIGEQSENGIPKSGIVERIPIS